MLNYMLIWESLLYILRDFEKAGSHYRLAIQQDKKFKSIYQQKTQELLQELIEKISSYPELRRHEMLSVYQQVLLFNPNDDEARSQLSKLQKLMENLRGSSNHNQSQTHYVNCRCPQCVNYT